MHFTSLTLNTHTGETNFDVASNRGSNTSNASHALKDGETSEIFDVLASTYRTHEHRGAEESIEIPTSDHALCNTDPIDHAGNSSESFLPNASKLSFIYNENDNILTSRDG